MAYLASLEGAYSPKTMLGKSVLKRKLKNIARKTGNVSIAAAKVGLKVAPAAAAFIPGGAMVAPALKLASVADKKKVSKITNTAATLAKKGVITPAEAKKAVSKAVAQVVQKAQGKIETIATPPIIEQKAPAIMPTKAPAGLPKWAIPAGLGLVALKVLKVF